MLKKFWAILLSITLLISYLPAAVMAAEAQQTIPVHNEMESTNGVTGIEPANFSLTQDKVSGDYAVKASYGDIPSLNYARYTLAASDPFDIKKYSQIKLWIKPGAGASWIKFYTNNNIITSDKNGDGTFKVGEDLISGKWNAVTLDLSKLSITSGKDLVVDTNEYSNWTYDEVKSLYTPLNSVDITFMEDSKTQLVNGQLQFKKNGSTFDTTPTVLVPGSSKNFTKTDTDQAQFQQGTLENVTATAAGDLELSSGLTGQRTSPVIDISTPYSAASSQVSWNSTSSLPGGTFTRSSVANKNDGTQVTSGTPRYENGKYGQGITIEEGTTNLLTANQSDIETSMPNSYNTDGVGVSLTRDTTIFYQGAASLKIVGGTDAYGGADFYSASSLVPFTVTPGQTYTFSAYIRGAVGGEVAGISITKGDNIGYYLNGTTATLTTQWQRISATVTIPAGVTSVAVLSRKSNSTANQTWYLDNLQFEQKPYTTSWITGGTTRANETLTVPPTILNPAEGIVEGWFNLGNAKTNDYSAIVTTGANSTSSRLLIMRDGIGAGGKLRVWDNDGTGEIILTSATVIQPSTWYYFSYTWSPTGGRSLYLNGIKEASNSATRGTSRGTENQLFIGSYGPYSYANGVIDDLRLSNKARSQSEVQSAYASGNPSSNDSATTYKMNFDGNVQGTGGYFVTVETNLSLDGGSTWQGWKGVSNGGAIPGISAGTNLSNARLQYRVNLSALDSSTSPKLNDITIKIGQSSVTTEAKIGGKITNINIDSGYVDTAGNATTLANSRLFLPGISPTILAISGDGSKVYYGNPSDGGKLYLLNLLTGENKKVSDYIPTKIKVNEEGKKAVFSRVNSSLDYLYFYNEDDTTNPVTTLFTASSSSDKITDFDIQNNGTIYYLAKTSTTRITKYINGTSSTVWSGSDYNITKLAVPKMGDKIFCIMKPSGNDTQLYSLTNTNGTWEPYALRTTGADIMANADGSLIYFPGSKEVFQVSSKAARKIEVKGTALGFAGTDKILSQLAINTNINPPYAYKLYDVNTDTEVDIKPGDARNPVTDTETGITPVLFSVSNDGSKMAYTSWSGLATYYINGAQRPERYLFSFDGKNSWHTYKDGAWSVVKAGAAPSADDLKKYGMTIDEVNGMTPADFEGLYEDGREISQFDAAVYFASVDPTISPALKGIKVTLNGGQADGEPVLEKSLYTTKEQVFDAKNWRKLKKIYPVEIFPREADARYLIVTDTKHVSYKNNQWVDVAPELFGDTENKWIEITQQGMTAEELRAIPESALEGLLPTDSLTVQYALKVEDMSTDGYSSQITVDYVENLFASQNLVLKITMTDGTVKEYANLTKQAVEDFMQWLNERQYNRGPIFYTIKTESEDPGVAATNKFVNYYMIVSVDVDEME